MRRIRTAVEFALNMRQTPQEFHIDNLITSHKVGLETSFDGI
jgi:hypothetical protein